ncbi:MAG TPA: hypothetical protein DCQ06_13030 [Myxococcales bacterium]|nr:hypothetical protein [Myxococcales bacterium]HAN32513.1 hypothetical protein [Myxococcales bacterium]
MYRTWSISTQISVVEQACRRRWRDAQGLLPAFAAAIVLWLSVVGCPTWYLSSQGVHLSQAQLLLALLPIAVALWSLWLADVVLFTWLHLAAYVPVFVARVGYLDPPLQQGAHGVLTASALVAFVLICWSVWQGGWTELRRFGRLGLPESVGCIWLLLALLDTQAQPSRIAVASVTWLALRRWPLATARIDHKWTLIGALLFGLVWWRWA